MNYRYPAIVAALLLVATGGYMAGQRSGGGHEHPGGMAESAGDGPCPGGAHPEYWVAPMDASFRRDGPGKSPMGMALVPYCGDASAADGVDVRIAPQVVQNLGVRTAAVTRAPLDVAMRAVGTVEWNAATLQHIHTRAEGWVDAVDVAAVGDPVRAGQRLYSLYSPKLFAAEAEYLAAGNALLRQAAGQRLRALGYTAAQVADLQRRKAPREQVKYRAGGDRVVVELDVRAGQYVTPGTKLMVLADPQQVWMTVAVPERDAARIAPGQRAVATVPAWPGRQWEGTVAQVYPELDPQTRSLRVRLEFANPDGDLRPQMHATVTITPETSAPLLTVPNSALIRTGAGARVVKALGDGQFAVVAVARGVSDGQRTAVQGALREGDAVVIAGQFLIDSEANVDAEALRLGMAEAEGSAAPGAASDSPPAGMADATVIDVDAATGNILLEHGEFAPIGPRGMAMGAMTMGFSVADEVDLTGVTAGDRVQVVVTNPARGAYVVTELQSRAQASSRPPQDPAATPMPSPAAEHPHD